MLSAAAAGKMPGQAFSRIGALVPRTLISLCAAFAGVRIILLH